MSKFERTRCLWIITLKRLKKNGKNIGKIMKHSRQMYGIFLLESWYSECCPYGNSGTWIFRQSCFLRCNRNDRQNSCLSWICRNFWLHSHLLRRPDCLDHSNLLYFSDMPVVHPKVYKNACIYSSPSK